MITPPKKSFVLNSLDWIAVALLIYYLLPLSKSRLSMPIENPALLTACILWILVSSIQESSRSLMRCNRWQSRCFQAAMGAIPVLIFTALLSNLSAWVNYTPHKTAIQARAEKASFAQADAGSIYLYAVKQPVTTDTFMMMIQPILNEESWVFVGDGSDDDWIWFPRNRALHHMEQIIQSAESDAEHGYLDEAAEKIGFVLAVANRILDHPQTCSALLGLEFTEMAIIALQNHPEILNAYGAILQSQLDLSTTNRERVLFAIQEDLRLLDRFLEKFTYDKHTKQLRLGALVIPPHLSAKNAERRITAAIDGKEEVWTKKRRFQLILQGQPISGFLQAYSYIDIAPIVEKLGDVESLLKML